MKLRTLTTETNTDGTKIVRVSGCVSDNHDPEKQQEWISFQFAVDVPTVRNGAILRQEVLEKARDILHQLRGDFQHISDQTG